MWSFKWIKRASAKFKIIDNGFDTFFFLLLLLVILMVLAGSFNLFIIIFHLWLGVWFGLIGFISMHQEELKSICVLCVLLKHFCLLVYQLSRGHIWRDVRCYIHLKEYQVLYRPERILENVSAGTVGKIKVRLTRMRRKY